jgi:hypothetical protein
MASYDTTLINDASFAADQVAALTGFVDNGDGTYTLDGSTYGGALSDYWGPYPSANVASITVDSYNQTDAPGVITFQYNYQDGSTVSGFGGQVIGWDSNAVLVEVLDGFVPIDQSQGTYSGTPDPNNVLWLADADISYDENDNAGNGPNFPVTFDDTGAYPPPPCYVEGTAIRTAMGDVAVETLVPGDTVTVHTRDGMVERPVVWVGHRRVDIARHRDPEAVLPIRIRRGAFGSDQPSHDLWVSPDHAIYLDGLLIPAKLLVNGGSIIQEAGWSELAEHSIIYAENLRAESYLDTGNRAIFENGSVLTTLHPDFSITARLIRREDDSCAPFVVAPSIVRPIWHSLARRSGQLGYPVVLPTLVRDPELRLRTGTHEVRPLLASLDTYVFVLPADAQEVCLVSRAARPNESRPWLDDGRRLGVRIGRIIVKGNCDLTEIALDSPALGSGWWAVETDGHAVGRWTNGSGRLALPPGHGRVLELKLAGSTTYPVGQPEAVLPFEEAA